MLPPGSIEDRDKCVANWIYNNVFHAMADCRRTERERLLAEVLPVLENLIVMLKDDCCCTPDMAVEPSFTCNMCDYARRARALLAKLRGE